MKSRPKFVKRQDVQLAMREVSELAQSPRFWLGFGCIMAVLTVSAPFDSGEEFSAAGRAVYWSATGVATYFPAAVIIQAVRHGLDRAGSAPWQASLLGGAIAGVPVGLIVFLINSYIAGNDDGELKDIPRLIGLCMPISVAVAFLTQILLDRAEAPHPEASADATGSSNAGPPRLLERVKPGTRGPLQSLQAQDHYVEITTARGQELILMRLADAIAELDGVDGMQVHRSWWVSKSAIDDVLRNGHKMDLRLRDGRIVPVGRSRQKDVARWAKPQI